MPQNVAAEDETTEHFAFGVEYDWSNMDTDFESMTGLPLDEILGDVMQSADDAGIEMLILEEITGTSSVIIDQYDDGTMMFNPADGSGSVEVTKHVTELTLRHGGLMDMALITEWSDAYAGWDLTISGGNEGIFNVDAFYVEYRDASGLIYGHDLEMSMNTEQLIFFDLEGSLEADDGDSVMPLDIHMEAAVDYAVTNAQSEVVYSEASTLYQAMSALEGGDDLHWSIGESDDDYVYWYGFDEAETNCEWKYSYEEYECHTIEIVNADWTVLTDADSCDWSSYEYECYGPGYSFWFGYCEYYDDTEQDTYACTNDFGNEYDWEYYLDHTNYEDGTQPPGVGYENWDNYPYCEHYDVPEEFYCTYDFGHDEDYENSLDWTHYEDDTSPLNDGEIWDEVESHEGTFSTATGFNFELTGLPAEELGFAEGKWDVSASDDVTDSGSFDEEYECDMGMKLFEGTQMITTDGDQIEVMQAHTSPLPFGMTCHIGNLFVHTFVGSEDAPSLEDMIADSTKEIAESMGGNGDSHVSSDMLEVEMRVHNQDEIEVSVYAYDLDPDITYEVNMILEDSDGNFQDSDDMVIMNSYSEWDDTWMSTSEWGENCVTAQLKDVDSNQVVDSVQTCAEVAQEPKPSQLLEDIIEGFSDSTLENVMENFGSNLEYRLENYEADFPYDDGDMFVLWDDTTNMVVGFQMVVTSDDSNMWYTLIGPESDSYGTAPAPLSFTYFSGQQAIAQEADIEDDSTLEDLVDLTAHNDQIIEDAIEDSLADNNAESGGEDTDDDSEDGLLPFMSPVLTLSMIAIAGLVASLRSRKE
tara:strand:- start:1327 stop:3759 length:2433 start_codon:yes stop_codon:yes gene_type:complete